MVIIRKFTFHNVSINSLTEQRESYQNSYLHSIMYLLIHGIKNAITPIVKFTFHNVSINSHNAESIKYLCK